MDNCLNTTKQMLKLLQVEHTNTYLKDHILSHPDHPSLLAIADTLEAYHIEQMAVKIGSDKFDELPTPCVVQVLTHGRPFFYVLQEIEQQTVRFFDENNKQQELSKDKFLELWTGVALMAETNAESKEEGIEKKKGERKLMKGLIGLAAIGLGAWVVLNLSSLTNTQSTTFVIIASLLFILKGIGLTAGVFLLWFEVDQYNPTVQAFCSGGKKVDCNSVLTSKHAKLFNNQISLGNLGFAYFFATLSYFSITSFSPNGISTLGVLSLLTLPIIAISAYYQAVIIKQWCKFCLVIQAVLLGEVTLAFTHGVSLKALDFSSLPVLLGLFILPILSWKTLKPLFEQQKEVFLFKRGLKKIKNNPAVLEGLLIKSEKMKTNPVGLGISLTNPNAKYNIVKVCNPYCGPCAKAHIPLEDLVHKGTINLQMMFTATTSEDDRKAPPVKHLLAIDEKSKGEATQGALDDWYLAEHKDYDVFSVKYPMNGELNKQDAKLKAMANWCESEQISHTPTIFINGYMLPKEYSVEDLKEVLT